MLNKKTVLAAAIVLIAGVAIYNSDAMRDARVIKGLVAQNIEARGGAQSWAGVETLELSGQMDLGQGMHVPYVIEQKRPGKMCLDFVFDEETATQCVDGEAGWKRLPFRGRNRPEAMSAAELREMAGAADIDGLLFNYQERGHEIELVGKEMIGDRMTSKLQVTLPTGAVRWLYIEDETGLDIKLEAMRVLRGEERLVSTYYLDWQETDGLLIPRRQETQTEGSSETHFLTVENVRVNVRLDDSRFAMPSTVAGTS